MPYSWVSMPVIWLICARGGMMRLIMDVPAPRAACRLLTSCLIFHTAMLASRASDITAAASAPLIRAVWREAVPGECETAARTGKTLLGEKLV